MGERKEQEVNDLMEQKRDMLYIVYKVLMRIQDFETIVHQIDEKLSAEEE